MTAFHSSPLYPPALAIFPLLQRSMSVGTEVDQMSHLDWPYTITHSQHYDQFCISVPTVALCKKKLLWCRLRAAQLYRYKHEYSGDNLATGPFNRTVIVNLSRAQAALSSHFVSQRVLLMSMGSVLAFHLPSWWPESCLREDFLGVTCGNRILTVLIRPLEAFIVTNRFFGNKMPYLHFLPLA